MAEIVSISQSSLQEKKPDPTVQLKLVKAKLSNSLSFGKLFVYALLANEKEVWKSQPLPGTQPQWESQFFVPGNSKSLSLKLFNKDSSDQLIGSGHFKVETGDFWVEIYSPKGDTVGSVFVSISSENKMFCNLQKFKSFISEFFSKFKKPEKTEVSKKYEVVKNQCNKFLRDKAAIKAFKAKLRKKSRKLDSEEASLQEEKLKLQAEKQEVLSLRSQLELQKEKLRIMRLEIEEQKKTIENSENEVALKAASLNRKRAAMNQKQLQHQTRPKVIMHQRNTSNKCCPEVCLKIEKSHDTLTIATPLTNFS